MQCSTLNAQYSCTYVFSNIQCECIGCTFFSFKLCLNTDMILGLRKIELMRLKHKICCLDPELPLGSQGNVCGDHYVPFSFIVCTTSASHCCNALGEAGKRYSASQPCHYRVITCSPLVSDHTTQSLEERSTLSCHTARCSQHQWSKCSSFHILNHHHCPDFFLSETLILHNWYQFILLCYTFT